VASTETYAAPGTSGNIMKSDGTNWTSAAGGGGTPGGADTQIQFNDAGAFNGNTNFTITKSTNTMTLWGMKFIQGPGGAGSAWIDMPTGSGGIGSGGSGTNPWIAIVGSAGNFFGDAAVGDVIYRNTGKLLFAGQSGGNSAFALASSSTIGMANNQEFGWTSTSNATAAIDTGFARNAAGTVEINNGTATTYRDLIARNINATTAFQVNGVAQAQEYINASTSTQTITTAETYVTGSSIVIPANGWKAGSRYKCRFDITKTTAGTAAWTLSVRAGTAGSTADTAIITAGLGAQTAVADTMIVDLNVTIRTTGGSATSIGNVVFSHNAASGTGYGFSLNVTPGLLAQAATFNTGTATTIGVSFNGGASHSGSVTTVQAELTQ